VLARTAQSLSGDFNAHFRRLPVGRGDLSNGPINTIGFGTFTTCNRIATAG